MTWTCKDCTAVTYVGAPSCPQCGGTDLEETRDMPKTNVNDGPTDVGLDGYFDEGAVVGSGVGAGVDAEGRVVHSPEVTEVAEGGQLTTGKVGLEDEDVVAPEDVDPVVPGTPGAIDSTPVETEGEGDKSEPVGEKATVATPATTAKVVKAAAPKVTDTKGDAGK